MAPLFLLLGCTPVAGQEPPPRAPAPSAAGAPDAVRAPDAAVRAPDEAVRAPTDYTADRSLGGAARVALSAKRLPTVEALFAAAGVTWPAQSALIRVYKQERELEVWAANDGPLQHIATWGVCAASGELGPKRREGDWQVPEGFYTIDLFNPTSAYHLSLRVSYPNRSDRLLGDPTHPGSAIMIHGACASIGCVALTDERIEEVWQIASSLREQKRTVYVHMLPARDLDALIASKAHPEHEAFWRNLAEGDAIFRTEKRIPSVTVDDDGRYRFR